MKLPHTVGDGLTIKTFLKLKKKKDMQLAIQSIKKIFGQRPLGWYTGRCSPNTRDLVIEEGGFLYDSDSYSDDLALLGS